MRPLSLSLLVLLLLPFATLLQTKCDPDQGITLQENTIDSPVRQILWVDDDAVEIYLLSQENFVYKSNDEGKTWTNINNQLPFSDERQPPNGNSGVAFIAPTADEKKVYLIGYGFVLWSTTGDGKYNYYRTSNYIESITPHPTSSEIALASALSPGCFDQLASTFCFRALYLTTNFGQGWKQIAKYTGRYAWGSDNTVFMIAIPNGSGNQYLMPSSSNRFYVGPNLGSSFSAPLNYTDFAYKDEVLFTAQIESSGLSLWVSFDDGSSFKKAQFDQGSSLPLDENHYNIIDASEAMTFINIQHSDARYGTTYYAPNYDEIFSISLRNNKKSTYNTDFIKVQGIDGIYFANQYDVVDAANPSVDISQFLQSLITFDKGSSYSRLPVPTNVECQDSSCSLHLFGYSDYTRSPFYSVSDAVGIITGSGNVGQYRQNGFSNTHVYFSSDAGESWQQVRNGSYIYEYGDLGGLIIFASNDKMTDSIFYTWNDGIDFHECVFSDKLINVQNIRVEPSFTSRKFLLHGSTIRDDGSMVGVVILIDFTTTSIPQCQGASYPGQDGSDYELWQPGPDGCLLGEQVLYTRRKPTSECYNSDTHEAKSIKGSCLCTQEDYICDVCFEKALNPDGSVSCVNICEGTEDDPLTIPLNCNGQYTVTQGYALVPGDACDYLSIGAVDLMPIVKSCPSDDESDIFLILLLFVILVILLLLVGAVVAVIVLFLKNQEFHDFVSSRFSFGKTAKNDVTYNLLNDNGDPNDADNLSDLLDDQYDYSGINANSEE